MGQFVSEGVALDLTAPSGGFTAYTGVKIGSIIGIPTVTAAQGVKGAVWVTGVWLHASATSQSWSEGDLLYWDDTAKTFTKTSSGNTKAGYAAAAKASSDATGYVRLVPSI